VWSESKETEDMRRGFVDARVGIVINELPPNDESDAPLKPTTIYA
jgi:hypothetical protein